MICPMQKMGPNYALLTKSVCVRGRLGLLTTNNDLVPRSSRPRPERAGRPAAVDRARRDMQLHRQFCANMRTLLFTYPDAELNGLSA